MTHAFLTTIVLVAAGCRAPEPKPVTSADGEVIEAVLTDFLSRDEEVVYVVHRSAKTIVLSDRTYAFGPGPPPPDIPPELMAEVEKRNPRRLHHSLKAYVPRNPNILIRDIKGVDHELGYSLVLTGTRGFVMTCLPGYSKDGMTALLVFGYGPSPHGTECFYILRKEHGTWTVARRHFMRFT